MALNFSEALWISAEIAQISESRGHVYISLVQKETEATEVLAEDKILAQTEAVIWARDYRRLKRQLGVQFKNILKPGLEVLIQAKVEYHERYGLKLLIQDIDPAYTVGKLELQRQETLQMLTRQGLLDKNKKQKLPKVLQKIAVISSERAAGYQDFQRQLTDNPYAYQINYTLLNAAMQGDQAKTEIINRLNEINETALAYDAVVIIRGGGAKLDLHAFDAAELCVAIANCKIPVVTGIGHDIDETLADRVAFEALKTPTAVAEWIIQHNLFFEMNLLELGNQIKTSSGYLIKEALFEVEKQTQEIRLLTKGALQDQNRMLDYIEQELPRKIDSRFQKEEKKLEYISNLVALLHPENVFKRGFSMTLKNGKPISKADQLKEADIIESVFKEGSVKSKVVKE